MVAILQQNYGVCCAICYDAAIHKGARKRFSMIMPLGRHGPLLPLLASYWANPGSGWPWRAVGVAIHGNSPLFALNPNPALAGGSVKSENG